MIERRLALSICFALALALGDCCTGGTDSNGGTNGGNTGGEGQNPGAGNIGGDGGPCGTDGPLEIKLCITNDDVTGYDPSAYDTCGEITDTNELTCDFEGPCSWNNDQNDDADWLVGTKSPDEATFQQHFGPYDVMPEANYLFTGATGQDPAYKAIFKSCEVKCTQSGAVVLFDVYQTENPVVEVCTRPLGGAGEPENCVLVPKDPGAIGLAELPALPEGGEILIVASNFIAEDGDFVILDRTLEVQAEPCSGEGPTQAPTGECEIPCQFKGNTCGWYDAQVLPEEYLPERYRNGEKSLVPFTPVEEYNPSGIFPSGPVRDASKYGDDTGFLSGVIDRQEGAGLIYGPVNNAEDRILKLEYYCAFEYNQVSVCFEGLDNCPFESEPAGDYTDAQWKTEEVIVPANTENIIIVGRRKTGKEADSGPLSEVGVANVEWLDGNGDTVCPPPGRRA